MLSKQLWIFQRQDSQTKCGKIRYTKKGAGNKCTWHANECFWEDRKERRRLCHRLKHPGRKLNGSDLFKLTWLCILNGQNVYVPNFASEILLCRPFSSCCTKSYCTVFQSQNITILQLHQFQLILVSSFSFEIFRKQHFQNIS